MTKRLQCKAIIFDFDGTLADSMPFLEMIGVQVMIKYFGISEEEATERYRSTTGLPYEHQIKMNFPEHEMNENAIEEFEKLKIDRIFEQELFSDTKAVLQSIRAKSISIFVSSSTFQTTITEYFSRRGLSDFFVEILGYKPGFEKGAHHFRHVQSNHNFDLSDVVFVGDSLKDFERSKGFCRFIGISHMFSLQEFRSAGHNGHVVDNLSEVPSLL